MSSDSSTGINPTLSKYGGTSGSPVDIGKYYIIHNNVNDK